MEKVLRHLYVHVPFCPSICPYCDFHVLTRGAGQVDVYLGRLRAEAAELASQYEIELETVYLGGGTPSFLRDAEMAELVDTVRTYLGWGSEENTLEVNPGTLSDARARHWRDLGFDRASIGVQSLDDTTLKFLGRGHNARQARQAVCTLLEHGFRVSGDLITAVAGQPLAADIRGLVSLGVEHISAYSLTIEPGTEFERRGIEVTEEDERSGFEYTADLLEEAGFERYEISNYAKPNAQSRHNLAYWNNKFYLGIGPSAAGHYPMQHPTQSGWAQRRTNPRMSAWLLGGSGTLEPLSKQDTATDALFMGLRLISGLSLIELSARVGFEVAEYYQSAIQQEVERGRLIYENGILQATSNGRWALNDVVRTFLRV